MNPDSQDRNPGSGLLAWVLWVLASAAGGAILALLAEPLGIVGFLFLSGVVLGTTQALVLRYYLSYLPGGSTGVATIWVFGSFVGWLGGSVVFVLVRALARLTGVSEIAHQVGSIFVQLVGTETARILAGEVAIWVTFAAFQGAALALVAIDGPGGRSLLPWAALWVPAGAIGGVLAAAASSTVVAAAFPVGGFDLFFDRILPSIVGRSTAGALYGATTGVVLAMIARRMTD